MRIEKPFGDVVRVANGTAHYRAPPALRQRHYTYYIYFQLYFSNPLQRLYDNNKNTINVDHN